MSLLVAATGMLAAVLAGGSAPPVSGELPAWLAGCWAFERGNVRVEEQWMAPAGGLMLGISRTVRGDAAVEHEFLVMRFEGNNLVLIASPSGQATTAFHLVGQNPAEVVFANPSHDFPQRITYRRSPDGGVVATVEGNIAGAARVIELAYRGVSCPGRSGL